jgi:hypothetical protein
MKMRAGGRFQARKPALAAASNAGTRAALDPVAISHNTAPARETVTASMPAIASMPSMKL